MVIDEHPVLIHDSTSLWYDIILGADFLDTCGLHFDYDNNLVHWMEFDITLYNVTDFFIQLLLIFFHTNWTWS